ncbi:substrate-binding domain-containing protein [Arthrobacter sp. AK01]|uniref:substrate-binding domain-containing protein n=1 Tax=Arthrobacter sp. AK01 TaxID=2894084 RepID=UPI001E45BDF8|nr:substrate-binding domain-containing protein [Arthrobacter sp. AK01]MCD4850626.1 substrate-binding domain-containing protein [Arthrobacter sp. AK01]
MKRSRIAAVGTLICSALLLSSCASGASTSANDSTSKPQSTTPVVVSFDPKTKDLIPNTPVGEWCGPNKANAAVFDGIPLDAWRRIALEVFKKEAAKCASIDQNILHVSAGGDAQKANSDIDALAAQGYKLITGWADFGEAQLPSLRAATAAGATVVPYGNQVGGTPGVDYAANTYLDNHAAGEEVATAVAKNLGGKGKVISVGGAAGAKSTQTFHDGVKDGLKKYPDVTLINNDFIVTDWSPVEAQKKMSALISQNPDISAVIIDYGATGAGVVNAFISSGKKIPTIGVLGAANEIACLWKSHDGTDTAFNLISADSVHATIMAAAQQAIAAATGGKYNAVQSFTPPLTNDTAAGQAPKCDPSLPVDTDFTSPLTVDELVKVLKESQQ